MRSRETWKRARAAATAGFCAASGSSATSRSSSSAFAWSRSPGGYPRRFHQGCAAGPATPGRTRVTGYAAGPRAPRLRPSRCSPWRSASGRPRPSSASSTACCSSRSPTLIRIASSPSTGPIPTGRRTRSSPRAGTGSRWPGPSSSTYEIEAGPSTRSRSSRPGSPWSIRIQRRSCGSASRRPASSRCSGSRLRSAACSAPMTTCGIQVRC